jgi:anti-sigma regulatory factor (Ser/Thr protein kinase)
MTVNPRARPTTPGVPVLDQRFDIDDLYQVRAAVAAHAAELGLATELANDVVIAVHELASNCVRHGPGYGRLRLWADQQVLTCEVADGFPAARTDAGPPGRSSSPGSAAAGSTPAGAGSTAAGSADAPAPLPWPVEPGHGLWLVGKVADHLTIGIDDHGATATVTFAVRH